jgi:hypothetical protein
MGNNSFRTQGALHLAPMLDEALVFENRGSLPLRCFATHIAVRRPAPTFKPGVSHLPSFRPSEVRAGIQTGFRPPAYNLPGCVLSRE